MLTKTDLQILRIHVGADVGLIAEEDEEGKGGGSLCWSAAEQSVSIRLCSEVTNCELPQMQAKSEISQLVAEMPASVASCWRGVSASLMLSGEGAKKEGGWFLFPRGGLGLRHNWGAQ